MQLACLSSRVFCISHLFSHPLPNLIHSHLFESHPTLAIERMRSWAWPMLSVCRGSRVFYNIAHSHCSPIFYTSSIHTASRLSRADHRGACRGPELCSRCVAAGEFPFHTSLHTYVDTSSIHTFSIERHTDHQENAPDPHLLTHTPPFTSPHATI